MIIAVWRKGLMDIKNNRYFKYSHVNNHGKTLAKDLPPIFFLRMLLTKSCACCVFMSRKVTFLLVILIKTQRSCRWDRVIHLIAFIFSAKQECHTGNLKRQKQPLEVFEKMFLEISQNSYENTCARVSF